MRTANPALNDKTFRSLTITDLDGQMTLEGTAMKTFWFLFLTVSAAFMSWQGTLLVGVSASIQTVMIVLALTGLGLAILTVFKKEWAIVTGSLYSVVEGALLGILSLFFELMYPGIVIQAVLLTFGTLFALLVIYRTGAIQVTQNFRLGVAAATGGIMILYLVGFVGSFVGFNISFLHDSSLFGIGFNLFVVGLAAVNLVLDFDFIERGVENGAPKYMEWYAAFGLMVTLIWLYIEILRLLSRLRSRK